MKEELYRKLDEDCRKKLIYKMALERDEDKNWISNQIQEWEASHGQGKYVAGLGGLFQGTVKPKRNSELELSSWMRSWMQR